MLNDSHIDAYRSMKVMVFSVLDHVADSLPQQFQSDTFEPRKQF